MLTDWSPVFVSDLCMKSDESGIMFIRESDVPICCRSRVIETCRHSIHPTKTYP